MSVRAWIRLAICCLVVLCLISLVLYDGKLDVIWTYTKTEYLVPVRDLSKLQVESTTLSNTECGTTSTTALSVASSTRPPPRGFVLALRFWEQQTQAMQTLVHLQCLADHMGLSTVEPFLYKSFLGFPLPNITTGNNLHLSDLIDIDIWNKETTTKFNLLPLSSWSDFLKYASRNVILVCMRHRNPPHVAQPKPGYNYRIGCPSMCFHKLSTRIASLNSTHPFRVVHEACVNFVDYGGAVSEKSLFENILGKKYVQDVTVVMNEFRGFFGLYRAPILSNCGLELYKPNLTIVPSIRIQNDAKRYIAEVFHGEPYIAILVRVERVVLHLEHNMTECNSVLKSLLQTLSKQCNTKNYFLAMDVGKFGSRGSIINNLTRYGHAVLNTVYEHRVSFMEWEAKFELYTSTVEEAYVANLQRAIAAESQCLIMFGAGGFQGKARDFYERSHPNHKDRCIHKICHDHRDTAHIHVTINNT